MKKRCKKAPDPRIKHRVQIGETTDKIIYKLIYVFLICYI